MKVPLSIILLACPCLAADFQRELSADRPDATKSPYTVEPGRFQVESSLRAIARDREAGGTTETRALAEHVGVAGNGPYEASAFAGLTWSPAPDLPWNIAVGTGLNGAAEDFSIAQGVTFRF